MAKNHQEKYFSRYNVYLDGHVRQEKFPYFVEKYGKMWILVFLDGQKFLSFVDGPQTSRKLFLDGQ